jgi:hypothetical protein
MIILSVLLATISPIIGRAADPAERHLELKEVEVKPKRVKYSKKNNPAVDFVRRVMDARHLTDPKEISPYYQYGEYERINIGMLDFDVDSTARFGFLHQYVDTSNVSESTVLNLSVKEKVSDHYFRRNPRTHREVVLATNRRGIDDAITDDASMQTFLNDVFREIDLYQANDITILQNRFVSPLGSIATDFYKYYLTDTIADAKHPADSLVVLSFVPKNPAMFGFNGKLYVVKGDSTMFIRRVQMRLPKAANVNFVRNLLIEQEYDRAPNGSRLKLRDELTVEMSVLSRGFYARRTTVYNSHSFSAPADSSILSDPREVIDRSPGSADAAKAEVVRFRPLDMQQGETHMDDMISRLRAQPLYYWTEQVMRVLVSGYIYPGGTSAKVGIGPMLSLLSYNDLEGLRMHVGGITTAKLSPRWFARGYAAYGMRDEKWKYSGEVEYSFIDKRRHSREFPVRSFRLNHTYDVDMLGQQYTTTNSDAFFLSLKRDPDNKLTYRRTTSLEFNFEFYNQFSVMARLRHMRQEATRFVTFTDGLGQSFSHYQQTEGTLQLRYAPGEKFYQSATLRVPINFDAPIFTLTHTFAPRNFAGARWGVNKTELSIEKRFWFSTWGYVDAQVAGGHVWGRSVFPSLLIPNANLSYIIQPNTYSLLSAMEFINDSYASTELTYWANGAILNYIPVLKHLKLREVVCFRALYGHLSRRNDPQYNPDLLEFPADVNVQRMSSTPYMELSVGLENIFKFLRVDYVRRLSYRNTPGTDRDGVRIGMHFTF